ncbi:MAG: proton-conducting transporter membrane subunit [Candidatus Omnitrophota bacterium]
MRLIPFFVIVPLATAFIISILGKKIKWISDILGNLGSFALLALSINSIFLINVHKALVYKVGGWIAPMGISMVLDGLSSFMLVTVNLVSFLVAIFSINYMQRYTDKWKFYTLFMLMLAGMNGIIITGDLFNLFVFLEIASIASYALVAFGTEAEELEASFKYAVMGSIASSFILLAIAFLYSYTSTLNLADMSLVISQKGSGLLIKFVTVLLLMGFGLKAALIPFHAWLPDAHPSAPAPISAMLSGVLIKVLGVYALIRLFFNVTGIGSNLLAILMLMGAISIIVGVFLAIGQWDLKRLLAYHSISQIGYVILGIGLGTPLGILGGLFHLFNHSIFKSLLFLNSGAIEYALGTRDLQKMGGLKKEMPVTAATSLVASMSIAGVPPFNGFWSKLVIVLACIEANRLGYAVVAIIGSILTLASFMKVQKYAFFGSMKEKVEKVKEVPFAMQLSMILFAVICLGAGLLLFGNAKVFLERAADALIIGRGYSYLLFN